MRLVLSHIGLALLCVCLSFYAVVATAGMQGTAMVICADGGAETIYVDVNGTPIEPGTDCCSCLDCNVPNFVGVLPALEKATPVLPRPVAIIVKASVTGNPSAMVRPLPRGPPPQQRSDSALARRMIVPATFEHPEMSLGDHSHRGGASLQGCPI